jgi:hypothetical protein
MSELGSTIGSGDFARINVSHKGPGPFLSRPTRWNVFLPMSMPIVAMPQGNWCCVAAPRPNLKAIKDPEPAPPGHGGGTNSLCDAGADKARRRPTLRAEDAEALTLLMSPAAGRHRA